VPLLLVCGRWLGTLLLLQLEYGVAQQCYVLGIEEAVVDELTW
jgi:hypothetical protein